MGLVFRVTTRVVNVTVMIIMAKIRVRLMGLWVVVMFGITITYGTHMSAMAIF